MTEITFFSVLEAGNPRSRFGYVLFLVRTLSLACRWHLSAVSSQDMGREMKRKKERERQRVCPLVLLLIKTLNLWDQGPSFMTSFNLNYFQKRLCFQMQSP